MNRTLCTDLTMSPQFLIVHLSVRIRGHQHEIRVKVPWKWLATDDVWEHIERENARRGRPRPREESPWLPLESWE